MPTLSRLRSPSPRPQSMRPEAPRTPSSIASCATSPWCVSPSGSATSPWTAAPPRAPGSRRRRTPSPWASPSSSSSTRTRTASRSAAAQSARSRRAASDPRARVDGPPARDWARSGERAGEQRRAPAVEPARAGERPAAGGPHPGAGRAHARDVARRLEPVHRHEDVRAVRSQPERDGAAAEDQLAHRVPVARPWAAGAMGGARGRVRALLRASRSFGSTAYSPRARRGARS